MTICARCHRPLKNPSPSGLGPVCAKTAQPAPEVSRDLFGYDIDAAVLAAQARLAEFIRMRFLTHRNMIRWNFQEARERLRVRP